MDDPRDKLLNSNNNLGINGKREKGIKFLSIISFSFFFFFLSPMFQRGNVVACNSYSREIVTAFRAMNISRRCISFGVGNATDRPTDLAACSYFSSNFRTFFPG